MTSIARCEKCGSVNNLLICSRCRAVYYCCKEHQTSDWKKHKPKCTNVNINKNISLPGDDPWTSKWGPSTPSSKHSSPLNCKSLTMQATKPFISEGSSEEEIIKATTEALKPNFYYYDEDLISGACSSDNVSTNEVLNQENLQRLSDISLLAEGVLSSSSNKNTGDELDILEEISRNVVEDMSKYGVCVVDKFLGPEKGLAVLHEVISMYETGVFKEGQLVSNKLNSSKTIRSDQITWIDGKEPSCRNIDCLIRKVDAVILKANTMENNKKMGDYKINGRSKAMVACYPGHGAHYVTHVDNPNKDGRCITAIYYLNKDWDASKNGGLLRIFPEGWTDEVADIEPVFDRLLFFWSDRRNPHEVQPAFKTRYAITLWYFDAIEREEAFKRFQQNGELLHSSS